VIVEATVKLRPRPDADRLVIARFGHLKEAGAAARVVMSSDLLPSALDLLDAEACKSLSQSGEAVLLIGVDGIPEQVEWQCQEVERLLRPQGLVDARVLDGEARDAAWRARGGLGHGAFSETAAVMRWSVLPAQTADVMEQGAGVAQRAGLSAALAAHAGIGVVEAVLVGGGRADAAVIGGVLSEWRALVHAAGGQALIEAAPLAVKEQVPVWDDPGPSLRIMRRIKSQLDPNGLLNPGRFVGGI
jgi:glycolate oxidase FAD binding subunit